tara:strand:+ start:784 stop:1587 length:804 start_codon:yes stop_codon:yes gene_type:complete
MATHPVLDTQGVGKSTKSKLSSDANPEAIAEEIVKDCLEMPDIKQVQGDGTLTLIGSRSAFWELVRKVLVGCPVNNRTDSSPVSNPLVLMLKDPGNEEEQLNKIMLAWTNVEWHTWRQNEVLKAVFQRDIYGDVGDAESATEAMLILAALTGVTFFGVSSILAAIVIAYNMINPVKRVRKKYLEGKLHENQRREHHMEIIENTGDLEKVLAPDGYKIKFDFIARDDKVREFLEKRLKDSLRLREGVIHVEFTVKKPGKHYQKTGHHY